MSHPKSPTPVGRLVPDVVQGIPLRRADPRRRVRTAAILLIALFSMSLASFVLYAAKTLFILLLVWHGEGNRQFQRPHDPDDLMYVQSMVFGLYSILFLLVHLFVLMGGIQMARLRSYWFCLFAAMLAIVPLFSAFLVVGVPIGAWAFRVLCRRDVRQVFRDAKAERRGEIIMAQ